MNEQMQSRIEQVRPELLAGTSNLKIMNKFGEEWKVSTRTVERVIQLAQDELEEERKQEEEARERVRQKHYEELEEQQIKNEKEIDAALMNIITGKARVKKTFYTAKGLEEREVEPDFNAIIRAANTYYKRAGARAAVKQKGKEDLNEKLRENRRNELLLLGDYYEPDIMPDEIRTESNVNEASAINENENKVEREEEMENGKDAVLGEQIPPDVEVKQAPTLPVNEPGTSTFNKWAIPFMPSRSSSYARRGGSRIKNFPVR